MFSVDEILPSSSGELSVNIPDSGNCGSELRVLCRNELPVHHQPSPLRVLAHHRPGGDTKAGCTKTQ